MSNSRDSFSFNPNDPPHKLGQEIALDMQSQLEHKDERYGIIFAITTICAVIVTTMAVIEFVKKCRDERNTSEILKNPRFRDRVVVKNQIRKTMSREDFKKFGDLMTESVFRVGGKMSEKEINELINK